MDPFRSSQVASSEGYETKLPELEAYLNGHWLTDMANFSAFVFHTVPHLNWAGFYLFDGATLRLGPFVGKPACLEIRPSRGVCGTAFAEKKAQLVADVAAFPGHISCDSDSRSELVLPLLAGNECFGVFDLDSPRTDRFHESDQRGLQKWIAVLLQNFPSDVSIVKPWA